jgi:Fanconi anemia group M protein
MLNKRLPAQLRDLKANYQKPLLLIEGLDDENIYRPSQHPSIHENAIRGMLLAVAIDFQIPIIFTKDYVDTATYLLLLAKRQLRPEREISLKVKRKTFSLAEQQQLIIEGFPGIGPALAKALLKKFGTIKAFINASEKQLKSIPKLGKKADLIKRLIETKYNYLC